MITSYRVIEITTLWYSLYYFEKIELYGPTDGILYWGISKTLLITPNLNMLSKVPHLPDFCIKCFCLHLHYINVSRHY